MIWEHISRQALELGNHAALVHGRAELSYEEAALLAASLAAGLPAPENAAGRRVFVRQPDPLSTLLSVLACWCRGLAAVVMRDGMPAVQLRELENRLRPCATMSGGVHAKPLGPRTERTPQRRQLRPRDEALVICTSGSSGTPKTVALPAESVCLTAAAIASSLELRCGDRVAVNTPLGYMYGLMGGCVASLWAGATAHLFDPHEPLTQLQAAIVRDGITVVQGPPSLFRLFMAYADDAQFPDVRLVTTGGEAFGDRLIAGLESAFPGAVKLALYGMTEAGPRISHERFDAGGGRDGCVGAPYRHFEWRIDSAEGHDDALHAGRLVLRGPSMFLGYIAADGSYEGLDPAGFFHSNDLVSMDSAGRLHFRGRIDRIFKSGGKLVNPDAIERILRQHGKVAEAVVRAAEHALLGLVPEADVIPASGAAFDDAELMEFVREHAEPHDVPRVIRRASGRLSDSGKLARAQQ